MCGRYGNGQEGISGPEEAGGAVAGDSVWPTT